MIAVPVFMYHHINRHARDLVTLSPEGFENHLRALAEGGIQTVFFDELLDFLRGRRSFDRPAAALTFDDGHLDNWVYAFPLLKKYRMRATIFAVTSWIGDGAKRPCRAESGGATEGLPEIPTHREAKRKAAGGDRSFAFNWEEAREMEASGCIDIQSHTHFHREYFPARGRGARLDPLQAEELLRDLETSKSLIESRLRKTCRFLAWPWGKYDPEALALARKAGFEAIATTEKGVNVAGADPLKIKRIVAKSGGKGWFSSRRWIYAHPRIGRWYSRMAGRI
jgi:peptidoglycan/xylan/chitin deacetylase (PgdA/CDA1 family)